jgi:hypothetical protein
LMGSPAMSARGVSSEFYVGAPAAPVNAPYGDATANPRWRREA